MAKGPFWVHLNQAHIAAHFVSVSSSSSCVPLPRVAFLAGTLRELARLFHGGINRGREQKPKGRRRRCRRRRLHGGPLSLPSFRRARPSQALLQEGTALSLAAPEPSTPHRSQFVSVLVSPLGVQVSLHLSCISFLRRAISQPSRRRISYLNR